MIKNHFSHFFQVQNNRPFLKKHVHNETGNTILTTTTIIVWTLLYGKGDSMSMRDSCVTRTLRF